MAYGKKSGGKGGKGKAPAKPRPSGSTDRAGKRAAPRRR